MNLNEFAQEVHQNAIAHGWWGEEYTDAAAIALIHAEISEALEEWRANRPMVYYKCRLDTVCNGDCKHDAASCVYKNPKPEGIAAELIDVALRILDAAAAWGYEIKSLDKPEPTISIRGEQRKIQTLALPEIVCYLHQKAAVIHIARINREPVACIYCMSDALTMAFTWLRAQNIDPEPLMLEKHEYNQTRPYKHGGKRI